MRFIKHSLRHHKETNPSLYKIAIDKQEKMLQDYFNRILRVA